MSISRKRLIICIVTGALAMGLTVVVLWILGNDISESQENKTEQNISQENPPQTENPEQTPPEQLSIIPKTDITTSTGNCAASWGPLTLINYNFQVGDDYIMTRSGQLVDLTEVYGITEGNPDNGSPLMDQEAAVYLNEMLSAYTAETGGTMSTFSCFRPEGTSCGRLCAATGTSEHHSGYACDLMDTTYGSVLDTDLLADHPEWQWLHDHSYEYGFIDRYPESWAGGSMDEPLNVGPEGTTGYFETWHYRYVGLIPAREIATGLYNNGEYDSLEHYLLEKGYLTDLLDQTSCTE